MSAAMDRIIKSFTRLNPISHLRVVIPPFGNKGRSSETERTMNVHQKFPQVMAKISPCSPVEDETRPDAELLALGREFDRYAERLNASDAEWKVLSEEHGRRMKEWRSEHLNASEIDYWNVYDSIMSDLEKRASHPHPDDIVTKDAGEMMRRILSLPATTVAGLAVKARLAKLSAPRLWDETDEDADWDDLCVRSLIDAALSPALKNLTSGETPVASAIGHDPIFAAIDRHRAAWKAGDAPWPEENRKEEDRAAKAWSDAEYAAFDNLVATTPTTVAGIAALAQYVVESSENSVYDDRYVDLIKVIARRAKKVASTSSDPSAGWLAGAPSRREAFHQLAQSMFPGIAPDCTLDIWSVIHLHKKAWASLQAIAESAEDTPEYKTADNLHWAALEALWRIEPRNARELAGQIGYLNEVARAMGESDFTVYASFDGAMKLVAERLSCVSEPPSPTKKVAHLTRRKKLTKAGLLHRYHAYLANELMTVSWELYGSRDYAMYMIPMDGFVQRAIGARPYKRGRKPDYFHNAATLPARATTVLKTLKINTTRPDH